LRRFCMNLKELAHKVFGIRHLFMLAEAIVVVKLTVEYV
jgi:hypothetical protein